MVLPDPGRAEQQRARPLLDAAAEEGVEGRDLRALLHPAERRVLVERDQPREDRYAAALDAEVVIAPREALSAVLDTQRRRRSAPYSGVRCSSWMTPCTDAVHGLVEGVGGQVVEQQHGRVMAGEIVLEREDLPPVAQRALGEQADLRQAVEHHPLRPDGLEAGEDGGGRFAELQFRRVQEGLLMVGVEQALRRHHLEDRQLRRQLPPVRGRAGPELLDGLRQRDVEALFALRGAFQQEAERDGGLAVPGRPSSRNTRPLASRPPGSGRVRRPRAGLPASTIDGSPMVAPHPAPRGIHRRRDRPQRTDGAARCTGRGGAVGVRAFGALEADGDVRRTGGPQQALTIAVRARPGAVRQSGSPRPPCPTADAC